MKRFIILLVMASVALTGCASGNFLGFIATNKYVDDKTKVLADDQAKQIADLKAQLADYQKGQGTAQAAVDQVNENQKPSLTSSRYEELKEAGPDAEGRHQTAHRGAPSRVERIGSGRNSSRQKGRRMLSARSMIVGTLCITVAMSAAHPIFTSQKETAVRSTAVSIPKFASTWFDRMEDGFKKAGSQLDFTVTQEVPSPASASQQVRLIEDATNRATTRFSSSPRTPHRSSRLSPRRRKKKSSTITHQSPDQARADYDVEMIDNALFGRLAIEEMVKALGFPRGPIRACTFDPLHGRTTICGLMRRILAGQSRMSPSQAREGTVPRLREIRICPARPPLNLVTACPDIKGFLVFGTREKGARHGASAASEGPGRKDRCRQHHRARRGLTMPLRRLAQRMDRVGTLPRAGRDGVPCSRSPSTARGAGSEPRTWTFPGWADLIGSSGNTMIYDRPIVAHQGKRLDQFRRPSGGRSISPRALACPSAAD